MGKVFSWEEVRDGQVPRLESFGEVARHIRQDLEASEGVVGGILCGSVLWGVPNLRSDIDCIVVYHYEQRRQVIDTLKRISKFAHHLHVPVEITLLDSEIVATPLHHIGRAFAHHLRHAARHGGIIKKNIMPLFELRRMTPREDVSEYVRDRLRKLEKEMIANTVPQKDYYHFLRRILEVAMHVARKILWWQRVELMNDSKAEVTRQYVRIASPEELRAFTLLTKTDEWYTQLLSEQLRRPDRFSYMDALCVIKEHAPIAGDFVRLSALRLASRNGNHKKKK